MCVPQVCGENGITYENECKLRQENCEHKTDVKIKQRAPCCKCDIAQLGCCLLSSFCGNLNSLSESLVPVQGGIYTLRKACMCSTCLRIFSSVALKQLCWSGWWLFFLVFSGKIAELFRFLCLSSTQLMHCPWLCTCRKAQGPQHFKDASHLWLLLCLPVCLLIISPDSSIFSTGHSQESLKVDVKHYHRLVWASHSTFHVL